jgi:hypothetical protein
MKADYKITREKFLDSDERHRLMEMSEAMAMRDRQYGRITWQTRWMLVHLAMNSGSRQW